MKVSKTTQFFRLNEDRTVFHDFVVNVTIVGKQVVKVPPEKMTPKIRKASQKGHILAVNEAEYNEYLKSLKPSEKPAIKKDKKKKDKKGITSSNPVDEGIYKGKTKKELKIIFDEAEIEDKLSKTAFKSKNRDEMVEYLLENIKEEEDPLFTKDEINEMDEDGLMKVIDEAELEIEDADKMEEEDLREKIIELLFPEE